MAPFRSFVSFPKSNNRNSSRAARRYSFEPLETRRLLAAHVEDGVLEVTGTSRRDVIEVHQSEGRIAVTTNGETRRFGAGDVESINIFCGGGNDRVNVGSEVRIRARVDGGDGDDTIDGGGGNDILLGHRGN